MVLTVASHLVSTLSVIHVDLKSNMREYKFKAVVITEDGKNLLSTDSLSIEELALYQGLEWEFSGGFVLLSDDIENGDLKYIQFTGLHDKNGKEIYEGDILAYTREEQIISIRWDGSGANWQFDEHDNSFDDGVGRGNWGFNFGVAKHCEIIGNIHENPELLKK